MSKKKRTTAQIVAEEMRKVGKEFGYDGTGWDISDKEAVQQRKRAELAGAIVRSFWNENKADIINAMNAGENKDGEHK